MTKVLLGFMGVGKTTIGSFWDDDFLDMDTMIQNRIGMTIADYFATEGEEAFRQKESELLQELMSRQGHYLISTGGGIVTSAVNRSLLQKNKHDNILLTASFEVLYDRIKRDANTQRPLFLSKSKVEFLELYQKRMSLYQGLADHVIDVDHKTPEEVVALIKAISCNESPGLL